MGVAPEPVEELGTPSQAFFVWGDPDVLPYLFVARMASLVRS
jgi:hypothetical protein